MTIAAILVAAGRGDRFGGSKHLAELAGRPLWKHGYDNLLEGGVEEVVVVGEVPGGVPGGERRRDSVAAGLTAIPVDAEWVLIHDAARPLARPGLIRGVLGRLLAGDVDAVVPVVPVRDTIKRVAGDRVAETLERGALVAVQTPQGFKVETLREAHRASDEDASDDALLVERIGGSVTTVPGDPVNLKITYATDLLVAEALL
jgi:2-C-methyl-D-erythritol 4-phosphate cytidylyltransferase